jgi:hypothetical protein
MVTRNSLIRACGALIALAMTAATLSAVTLTSREYVTFSGPVALPGVTLAAGTYVFEVANPMSGGDIILVRNRATYRPCFLGFSARVDRPAGLRQDQSVTLGETPKGVPPPILGWYPMGESTGHEFSYKKTAR